MLLAMAVYCNEENGRLPYLKRTLESLEDRVSFARHRLYLCDNASSPEVARELDCFAVLHPGSVKVLHFPVNLGTAAVINRAWREANPGETVCKMDDDVEILGDDWPDLLEDALDRRPALGICGLKRKDLQESPWSTNPFYRSTIEMLPHLPGQRWLVIEHVQHVFGTVQAYSPACRKALGYLYQMQDQGCYYGFDDSLASFRAHLAGFETAFLLGVDINHIDPGSTAWSEEKKKIAEKWMPVFEQVKREYMDGTRSLYWEDK